MAGKKLPIVSFQELHKRSSSNHVRQFEEVRIINGVDHARDKTSTSKSIDDSPKTAWNRRGDCIKLLDDFEAKYNELNKMFDKCLKVNSKKYLPVLEKVRSETQQNYERFVAESNQRIKEYEDEIEHIRSFKLFREMASELCPEKTVTLPSCADMKSICWVNEEKPNYSAGKPIKQRRENSGVEKVTVAEAKLVAEQTTAVNNVQRSKEVMGTGVILDRPTSDGAKEKKKK